MLFKHMRKLIRKPMPSALKASRSRIRNYGSSLTARLPRSKNAFLGKRKSPILVYGHMEPHMIVSFLGSVKAGHPYIPVDLSIPSERIAKIIESSGAELLIHAAGLSIDAVGQQIQTVSAEELLENEGGSVSQDQWVKEHETFYIIYTSGSTGNPKGVQISAANLQSFTDWICADFPVSGGKIFLNQAPFSFDLSVMDLYPCLQSGGTLHCVTKDAVNKPKVLFEELKKSGLNVWTSTPSFVQMCLMDPGFSQDLLPHADTFMFCGEVLPVSVAKALLERFPKAKIFNTYGPTEATVAVTSVEITADVISRSESLPVGFAKPDMNIFIMDEQGQPLPDGEKGEIVIAGPSVSRGYLGEPELTEKAFSLMKASGHTKLAMPALFKTVRFSAKDVWIFRLNFTAIEWSWRKSSSMSDSHSTFALLS